MKKTVLLVMGGLLMTTTSQAQWAHQPFTFAEASNVPLFVDAVDANTAWAASNGLFSGEGANQVARTFNGGQNWTVITVPGVNPATQTIQSISAVSATTAWVATLDAVGGRVLKTTDGGATWVQQSTATMFSQPDSWPNAIYFFNANDGVVMGDPEVAGGSMEIYYTANGGTTWTRAANVPVGTAGEYGSLFPPAAVGNSIWFANDQGDIFRSADKGVTWAVSRGVAADPIENIAFRDEQNGLALISDANATNHMLFRTTNGGATWSTLTYTGPLHGVSIDNVPGTGNYISVGAEFGNGDAGSSFSRDNGQTWTSIEANLNHLLVDAAGPTAVWSGAVGVNGAGEIVGLGVNKLTSTVLPTRAATLVLGASLSPNPSTDGQFRVQWAGAAHSGNATLTVADALGRQVLHRTLDATRTTEITVDLSREKAGLYQVKLESEAGVSHLRAQVL
ncbi:T9SS type A sorting domain-containing protein [Hymenobacter rigui]|uniref:T9SS C-terminal target domain-containing protein n=1 Tax=Hymenobacter rigui TaxID=334424 RepID=A0A428KUI0_9BACT|nr:T9SS type A sorting domain-containing protein [Hymenobacter rigui]RSK50355.1 T9SS C-terminal target domain-containing protein [Hymenobacter rigui]